MGLTPPNHLHFKNPFTEVNGNSKSVNNCRQLQLTV